MLVLERDQNVRENIQIKATVMIFTSHSTVYFAVQAVFSLEILKCDHSKLTGQYFSMMYMLYTFIHICSTIIVFTLTSEIIK